MTTASISPVIANSETIEALTHRGAPNLLGNYKKKTIFTLESIMIVSISTIVVI
jgi:hypothetical protein